LGVAADADAVLRESPHVVVLATGARAMRPDLPGLAEGATSAWDVLRGANVASGRVLVIDEEYGFQALSAAEALLDQGREVHIVTSERSIGSFLGATTAPPAFTRLFSKGIRLHCNLRVLRIEGREAIARNVWSDREEALGPYEHLVYAYGGESVCDLEAALHGRVGRLELIGDCFAPRTLQHAIFEGYWLAREL
jgi:thioredoxin reductase